MSAVIEHERDEVGFDCPGCGMYHMLPVGEGSGPRWTWNGCVERPTLQPSILARWDVMSVENRARNQAFYAENGRYMTRDELPYDVHHVCHSFVTEGCIQFLGDCTHALAGQTVPLPLVDPEA